MSSLHNYEELYTVLVQIEAVLNSRPLVPMLAQDGEGVVRYLIKSHPWVLLISNDGSYVKD